MAHVSTVSDYFTLKAVVKAHIQMDSVWKYTKLIISKGWSRLTGISIAPNRYDECFYALEHCE